MVAILTACGGGGSEPEPVAAAAPPPLVIPAPPPEVVEPEPEPEAEPPLPPGWRVVSDAPWAWRDGAGLLAKDGGLYLLGGWSGPAGTNSEVWFTRDLIAWEFKGNAPWPARHGAGWVVHNDRLYVISGDDMADVWSSPDGVTWAQHAAAAPFGPRYAPNATSFNGALYVYNGQVGWVAGAPDVWKSVDDGATWAYVGDVPYPPRGLIHGDVQFGGRLYTIAGGIKGYVSGVAGAETLAEFNDVWSTDDGINWRQETATPGFVPRYHHAALGTSHGCYVANGSVGTQLNTTGEVFFAPDCVNYRSINSPMGAVHATSMAEFNGSIVILGGHGSIVGSNVFQYFPS